jgi:hypothetical protein
MESIPDTTSNGSMDDNPELTSEPEPEPDPPNPGPPRPLPQPPRPPAPYEGQDEAPMFIVIDDCDDAAAAAEQKLPEESPDISTEDGPATTPEANKHEPQLAEIILIDDDDELDTVPDLQWRRVQEMQLKHQQLLSFFTTS